MMKKRLASLLVVACTLLLSTTAANAADGSKEDAATAYDRGASAYDRGDFATAATELARADELAQSAVTLELALYAAVRADNAALGMELALRAEKRKGTSTGSAKVDYAAETARKKLSSKVGKLNVTCPKCTAAIDGAPFEVGAPHFVVPGAHRISITRQSSSSSTATVPEQYDVTIEAGKTVELIPAAQQQSSGPTPPVDPKPNPPPQRDPPSGGVSPTWFWIAAGGAAVVGGITVVSAIDTSSKHDAFLKDRSNQTAANEGKAAEGRTIAFAAGAGALVLVSAALGLFLVNWSGDSDAPPSQTPPKNPRSGHTERSNGMAFRVDLGGVSAAF